MEYKLPPGYIKVNVESSQIAWIGHDKGERCFVCFKKDGSVYVYDDVTIEEFWEFNDAESIGKHFHSEIKNKPTTKVSHGKIS